MNKSNYLLQDRGSQIGYNHYLAAMDAVSIEKVASASVFFDPAPGNTIVDIGMASGTSSSILALLFPQVNIIGVDINPTMIDIARKTYQLPNLEFRLDDGEKLSTFQPESVNGFFNCSAIHHITSFNGYETGRAFQTIKQQSALLKTGGIIVVRDFVKPPEMEVILELNDKPHGNRPSDAELLVAFSKTARSLANANETGFPVKEISSLSAEKKRFQLFYADALEFIRRKDYYENWDIELQEEYGYFTQTEFEEVFANLGLRIIVSHPIYNPWIIRNRYKGQFALYDIQMNNIGFPPTNYLIAGEKVNSKGSKLSLTRHLPDIESPFLKYSSYEDKKQKIVYDVVQRPNSVVDIIPYFFDHENLFVLAKHAYPRPLVNITTNSPIIDQKFYGGYITEGLTTGTNQPLDRILKERVNIDPSDIISRENSLEYYTSPGGIDEKVESYFIRLNKLAPNDTIPLNGYSGFSESGTVRKYDALQLLKSAQTGALVEARLELNLYNLLRILKVKLPAWLGEPVLLEELEIQHSKSLESFLSMKEARFIPYKGTAGYLQKHRAKFSEEGITQSSNILEYVTPQLLSTNTLIALPVAKYQGEVYVGLEVRYLPVPQIHSENSCLLTAPAFRLPKNISTYNDLENYLTNLRIFDTPIKTFTKLGEKFFPSVGVTPEQVYPYVVSLAAPNAELQWVKLSELYQHPNMIKDGHLLVTVFRLHHALNLG